jgi:hypothetical protein
MLRETAVFLGLIILSFSANAQLYVFVAPNGNDHNNGNIQRPFKTVQAAVAAIQSKQNQHVVIEIRAGTYYLDSTIIIKSYGFKNKSLIIRGYKNEKVTFSGARPYKLQWQRCKEGVYKAAIDLPESPDRLFFNGRALSMARYPNYDSAARVFNGTAADAISDEKVKQWHNPAGAYVHALHKGEWGGFHYRVTGKDAGGKLLMEGGWQNNRPSPMNDKYRFVENVFEELDAPGEWYYDAAVKMLYLYPLQGFDIHNAAIAIGHLAALVVLKGEAANPVKNITLQNIRFEQGTIIAERLDYLQGWRHTF